MCMCTAVYFRHILKLSLLLCLLQIDVESFVNAGVNCLKPEYIAAYLTDHPVPKIDHYVIPEAQALLGNNNR